MRLAGGQSAGARMLGEISLAIRALRKSPGFVAISSATLAIGIGANTAVFSLFDALMLRSLPVERPGELAVLGPGAIGRLSLSDLPQSEVFSYQQYKALARDSHGVLAGVAATPTVDNRVYWGQRLVPGSDPQRASCVLVSGSYFPLLGIRPFRGRLLGPGDDEAPGANPVAVVSHRFWQGRLGAAANTVGSKILIQDAPYTVVGIVEPPFRGHVAEFAPDIWVPLTMQAEITRGPSRLTPGFPVDNYWLNVLMRLKTGITLVEAESAINARLQEVFSEQAGDGITDKHRDHIEGIHVPLTPMKLGLSRLRKSAGRPLVLLWAATGLVLLVACANLGGLLLVRASARRYEFGIRRALGGTLADLIRPLLAECAVLAAIGTAIGYVVAYGLVPIAHRWLVMYRGAGTLEVRLASQELLFATGIGAFTLFLFGLGPAALAARSTVWSSMRSDGTTATSARSDARARTLLVGAQCALAVVLLSTAGLFLRSLSELRATDLGLEADRVTGIRLDPQGAGFAPDTQPSMRRRILARVRSLPGVESAAFTGVLPLQGNHGRSTISLSGYVPGENEDMGVIHVSASPGYFETLGIRLVEGRVPSEGERDAIVVNQAFAARFFGGRSALGGVVDQKRSIVGVVGNVRQVNVRDAPPPLIYRSTAEYEGFVRTLAVRSSLRPEAASRAARDAVQEVVPGMPVDPQFETVELHLQRAVAIEQMLARLVGGFGGIALLLASLGLFGACSHMARTRIRETGIRMALGASGWQAQLPVLRSAAIMIGLGAIAGGVAAAGAGQVVAGVLDEVSPFNWTSAGWAVFALAASGFLAAAPPAFQTARRSPASVLHHE